MNDLTVSLRALSKRGTPVGAETLRQRVALQLAGGGVAEEPRRLRFSGPVVAAVAAAIAVVAFGSVALWMRGGEEGPVAPITPTTVAPPPSTTTAPTTVPPVSTTSEATTTSSTSTTTTIPVTPARLEVTWQQIPTQPAFDDSAFVNEVIAAGPGLVAVGGVADQEVWADAAVWVSEDGLAWERIIADEVFGGVPTARGTDMNQALLDVAAGPAGLVAVGYADTGTGDTAPPIWTSPDGITWARLSGNGGAFAEDVDFYISAIEAAGPGYVAVGQAGGSAAVWLSADGSSWTKLDEDLGSGFERTELNGIFVTDSGLVAVGTGDTQDYYAASVGRPIGRPLVWTSPDGSNWQRSELPSTEAASAGFVTVGNGLTVVLGWSGSDSLAWVSETAGGDFTQRVVASANPWAFPFAIVADGDRLLAVGVEITSAAMGSVAVAWASEDGGATWHEVSRFGETAAGDLGETVDQRPGGFRAAIHYGDGFMAVGATGNESVPVWLGTWNED